MTTAHALRWFRIVVLAAFAIGLFLLDVSLGSAPQIDSESSWAEVIAWGAINHVQWGKDIVFPYGPLGFLTPYYHHVPGAFAPFLVGQLLLAAAFSISFVGVLRHASGGVLLLFALAYLCAVQLMPDDIAFMLTLIMGATALIANDGQTPAYRMLLVLFALVSACIALIKFSLFPTWLLCIAALALQKRTQRLRHAVVVGSVFLSALLAVWLAAGQALGNLGTYLQSSVVMASGYAHAMGTRADPVSEVLGPVCVVWFGLCCIYALWRFRHDLPSTAVIALYAAVGFVFWHAKFTRGDHAPWLFAGYALMPTGLLCLRRFADMRGWRRSLVGLVAVCAAASLYGNDLSVFWQPRPGVAVNPATRLAANWEFLATSLRMRVPFLLDPFARQRVLDEAWARAANGNNLPLTRARIGNDTVDVLTNDQGIALLNRFNYAPRPLFQSDGTYTVEVARMNESYFLGPKAPKFVLLRLEAIDNRVPMSEDGLALIALLTHYRPVMKENGFLLLQRDESVHVAAAIKPQQNASMTARLGDDIAMDGVDSPAIAFIHLELNWPGKLYSFVIREPTLAITLDTGEKAAIVHRLVRTTAASGFLISPNVESNDDWTKLYLSAPFPKPRSFRIDAMHAWERVFFEKQFTVELRPLNILHGDLRTMSAEAAKSLNIYPGFNLMPVFVQGYTHTYQEDNRDSAGFQSPASLAFEPAPGTYDVNAVFGVQGGALNPGCIKAGADGVGVSLIRHRGGHNIVLWHGEIDPFHTEQDQGPHKLDVDGVKVQQDDAVEFFIDPGHGGNNQACDWAYVRDLTFSPR